MLLGNDDNLLLSGMIFLAQFFWKKLRKHCRMWEAAKVETRSDIQQKVARHCYRCLKCFFDFSAATQYPVRSSVIYIKEHFSLQLYENVVAGEKLFAAPF